MALMNDGGLPHVERDAGESRARRRERLRATLCDWLGRYGLAECAGLACAFAASVAVRRMSASAVASGYAAAWGESAGYVGVIVLRDCLAARRGARAAGGSVGLRGAGGVATGLVIEFGPAAVLDTLVIRPFTMALGMRRFGPRAGLLAGKCAADLLFYIPVILMYERRKRRLGLRMHDGMRRAQSAVHDDSTLERGT